MYLCNLKCFKKMRKLTLLIMAFSIAIGCMAQEKHPVYKTLTFDVKGCRIEMVYVRGGEFEMGCNAGLEKYGKVDERPFHFVQVGSFYMGRYEVTQRLWKALMGYNPSNFQGDDYPVEQVSHDEVMEFIRRLNTFSGKTFRLPTEAEWEYAARGGVYGKSNLYAGNDNLMKVAWGSTNSGDSTHGVGGLVPNELGIYDMTGNVWEWCSDWYNGDEYGWRNLANLLPEPPIWVHTREDYSKWAEQLYDPKAVVRQSIRHAIRVNLHIAVANPQGPPTGEYRIGRGGSWCDIPEDMRVSYRNFWPPERKLSNVGFRLVMEYDKEDSALVWMPGQYVLDSIADGKHYRGNHLEQVQRRENGVLEGLFSVAPDKQVRFAKGNLQYNAESDKWRFADRQTDYVGADNLKIKVGYAGWIDLFSWGTSGYHDKYPTLSVSNPAILGNGANKNIDGTSYDWGIYNRIMNGGDRPGLWRTLSVHEWVYLFTGRPNAYWLHTQGRILVDTTGNGRCVEGVILLPDNWLDRGFDTLIPSTVYQLSTTEWSVLEYAGAVFLPAAGTCYMGNYYSGMVNLEMLSKMGGVEGVDVSFGNRIPMVHEAVSEPAATAGSDVLTIAEQEYLDKIQYSHFRPNMNEGDEQIGYYWSTIHYDKRNAMAMTFAIGRQAYMIPVERLVKCAVRLVQDVADDKKMDNPKPKGE